jgi:uncharacterized membrane protein YphA (DoxX/SURF4 family)
MKRLNILYWTVTGLMCAFIVMGAVMDVLKTPDAIAFMKQLGYPEYLIRFLGVMKILGVVAVLIPRYPRLKEWAYAGLAFDTFGAFYSHLSNGDGAENWLAALVALTLVMTSYFLFRKRSDLITAK